MQWVVAIDAFLYGFLLAIPFIWIKGYILRTSLSTIVPLVIYWWLLGLIPHAGYHWSSRSAIVSFLGSLCTAHVKLLWSFVRKHIRQARRAD
jgi:hypothetical protein